MHKKNDSEYQKNAIFKSSAQNLGDRCQKSIQLARRLFLLSQLMQHPFPAQHSEGQSGKQNSIKKQVNQNVKFS